VHLELLGPDAADEVVADDDGAEQTGDAQALGRHLDVAAAAVDEQDPAEHQADGHVGEHDGGVGVELSAS
jgi:hypothetical protein